MDEIVTFEWNVLLDLSRVAATKTFGLLLTQLLLEVLSKSTWIMGVWVIHGVQGRGRYPRHTRWIQGVCRFCAT